MITFTAGVVSGLKRGRKIGYPTVNVDVAKIPADLDHGIYAVWVIMDNGPHSAKASRGRQWTMEKLPAVVHYGAHPAFKDTRVTFEVHFLDSAPHDPYDVLTVEIVQRIRDVQDFPNVQALRAQIQKDCDEARAILGSP